MEMIKANIGEKSKGRYFEATADKKQAFFVPVVHQKRVKNETTGEYEDGDVVWDQARFYGADADWVNKATQNGDLLLIWGRTERRTREVDGNEYKSIDVYVDAVPVNPRLREVTISRPYAHSRAILHSPSPRPHLHCSSHPGTRCPRCGTRSLQVRSRGRACSCFTRDPYGGGAHQLTCPTVCVARVRGGAVRGALVCE